MSFISFVFSKEGQTFAQEHGVEFYLPKLFTLKEPTMNKDTMVPLTDAENESFKMYTKHTFNSPNGKWCKD